MNSTVGMSGADPADLFATFSLAPAIICTLARDGTALFANDALFQITGYEPAEAQGMNWWGLLPAEESLAGAGESGPDARQDVRELTTTVLTKAGDHKTICWRCRGQRDPSGTLKATVIVGIDVTATNGASEAERLAAQTQAVLAAMLSISVMDIPLEEQLEQILKTVVSVPWIALQSRGAIFLTSDDATFMEMRASYQLSTAVLTECRRLPVGKCLCGRVASTGETQFASTLDVRHEVTYEGMSPHGHYCVPIRYRGTVKGVITLYLADGHESSTDEVAFLEAVANVLAGIIERRRAEEALRKTNDELESRIVVRTAELHSANEGLLIENAQRRLAENALREGLDRMRGIVHDTVIAMATTVEMRDPYTPGHQRRVAQLAGAIACEQGLTEDEIMVVTLAATVHDIGKIGVPAEILSRPGVLSTVELKLVQAHAEIGYAILKTIDFPWPIAPIVLQHHERIDGSGYPAGLTGSQILHEAKIIAVADVVEAIASHRPYRPALGMDKAAEEISNNSGILYDAEIAAAALRLIRDRAYRWD